MIYILFIFLYIAIGSMISGGIQTMDKKNEIGGGTLWFVTFIWPLFIARAFGAYVMELFL